MRTNFVVRNACDTVAVPLMAVQTSIGAVVAFPSPPFVIDHIPALQSVNIDMILIVDDKTSRASMELTG